jgi:hypothetical protein
MSHGAVAELARNGNTHAFDWPSRKTSALYVHTPPLFAPFAEAKRSGQAERRGEKGSRVSPRLRQSIRTHAEEDQAERSGKAERSGEGRSGDSPVYGNPIRTHAEEDQAECSAQVELSGEGRFGVSPDHETTQHAQARKKAKRSFQAERSGEG